MTTVEMPKANENLTEATLDRWLVKAGETVALNQPLCEIITDKAKFELPAPASGLVLALLAPERAMLPVGYVLCILGHENETLPINLESWNEALLKAHRGLMTSTGMPSSAPVTPDAAAPGAVRATPAARRVAKEQGVDLAAVAKALNLSGPVTEKDIKKFLEAKGGA